MKGGGRVGNGIGVGKSGKGSKGEKEVVRFLERRRKGRNVEKL